MFDSWWPLIETCIKSSVARWQRLRPKNSWPQRCKVSWKTEELPGFSANIHYVNQIFKVENGDHPFRTAPLECICQGTKAPSLLNFMLLDMKVVRACWALGWIRMVLFAADLYWFALPFLTYAIVSQCRLRCFQFWALVSPRPTVFDSAYCYAQLACLFTGIGNEGGLQITWQLRENDSHF